MNNYLNAMQRYFDFKGRSSRSQFWYFTLVLVVLNVIALILDGAAGNGAAGQPGPISGLIALIHLIPSLGVTVRRLHDIDKSGWWVLIGIIPLIGLIAMLVFTCTASTPGANRFGAAPANRGVLPPVPGTAPQTTSADYLDQLEKLTSLKAAGTIDDTEFQSMKADLRARSTR